MKITLDIKPNVGLSYESRKSYTGEENDKCESGDKAKVIDPPTDKEKAIEEFRDAAAASCIY